MLSFWSLIDLFYAEVVLTLAGSVFDKVGSYEQTGQPVHWV